MTTYPTLPVIEKVDWFEEVPRLESYDEKTGKWETTKVDAPNEKKWELKKVVSDPNKSTEWTQVKSRKSRKGH